MSPRAKAKITMEEPPEIANRGRYDWATISEELKKNPSKWHRVFDSDSASLATMLRNGDVASLRPSDGFEVQTRNNKRGTDGTGKEVRTCTLYLRWVKPKRSKR